MMNPIAIVGVKSNNCLDLHFGLSWPLRTSSRGDTTHLNDVLLREVSFFI